MPPQRSQTPSTLRRAGGDVIAPLAALAGPAAGQARHQRLGGRVEHDHAVDLAPLLRQHPRPAPRPAGGARKAVQQEATGGVRTRQAVAHDLDHDLVRSQLARASMKAGDSRPSGVLRLDGAAQDVAGRDVRDVKRDRKPLRLGPLPDPGRTKEQEPSHPKISFQWAPDGTACRAPGCGDHAVR